MYTSGDVNNFTSLIRSIHSR